LLAEAGKRWIKAIPQADFDLIGNNVLKNKELLTKKKVTKCPLMTIFRPKKTEWDTLKSLPWQGREGLRNNNAVLLNLVSSIMN
jgi:hypothetical protein